MQTRLHAENFVSILKDFRKEYFNGEGLICIFVYLHIFTLFIYYENLPGRFHG